MGKGNGVINPITAVITLLTTDNWYSIGAHFVGVVLVFHVSPMGNWGYNPTTWFLAHLPKSPKVKVELVLQRCPPKKPRLELTVISESVGTPKIDTKYENSKAFFKNTLLLFFYYSS